MQIHFCLRTLDRDSGDSVYPWLFYCLLRVAYMQLRSLMGKEYPQPHIWKHSGPGNQLAAMLE